MTLIVPLTFPITELREEYARLVPPALQSCLDGKDPFDLKSPVIGAGVLIDGHPVGIALASAHTKTQMGDIHSFVIESSYATRDLAERLLQVLTRLLIDQGVIAASFTYTQEASFSAILENVFSENHWQGPRPHIIECLFISADFEPYWLHKKIEFPKGFEEFFFKDLTSQEKKDLIHRSEQMNIPAYVFPFGKDKDLIEYKSSLGLRYQGRVIGWMVTHRAAPDIIKYSDLYIEDEFLNTGYGLKLLMDAIWIQKKEIPQATYALLEINLEQIPKRWLKFVERRLFPETCKITHKNIFWKNLKK